MSALSLFWAFICFLLPYLAIALIAAVAGYDLGRRDEHGVWSDTLGSLRLPYLQQRQIRRRYQEIDQALNAPWQAQEGRR